MYNQKEFDISLPELNYLKTSKLISQIGLKCKDFSQDSIGYWITNNHQEEKNALSVTLYGQIAKKSPNSPSGVRPIIKCKNMDNLIQNSKLKLTNNNIPIIEFGTWYSSKSCQLQNPTNLKFTNRCYPIGERKIGLEFEKKGKKYVWYNDKIYPLIPIKWYFDEENNLLLSVNSLFYALRKTKSKEFDLEKILKNQVLPLIIDSENKKNSNQTIETQINELLQKQKKLENEISELLSKNKIKTKTLYKNHWQQHFNVIIY